ncbi:hypothetical protein [Spirosoma sp.]|uniref:hypothetical protein n=1 Tax=Spirosoma sp. TaxID=1899569 RepID=UPI003B3B32D3
MSRHPQQHIVQISTPKNKAVLSKSQKEFNRLIQKIETLTDELAELRNVAQKIQLRIQTDYRPLVEQHAQLRADMVRVFDRAYERSELAKIEKKN